MKTIVVEIDENGDQTVDLRGYKGKGCAAVQEAFARAIGTSTKAVKKPEYFQPSVNKNTITR